MSKLRKPINKELLEQLYIKEGKSSIEISKILNIPCWRIIYQLKYYGFKMRNSGSIGNETKILKEDLYKLYVIELKTQKEIAKLYNCNSGTIRNYLIKYGFEDTMKGYRPKFSIRGDKSPMKRPEVRLNMSKNHADFSGKNNLNYGGTWMIGEGNPNWQGGLSKGEYPWEWNEVLKRKIRKRDNHHCQECNISEEEHKLKYREKLHIHHIDYNKNNINENNLITLCLKCNIKANYNRENWKNKFMNKMKNINNNLLIIKEL